MPTLLLDTKLYLPRSPRGLVPRPRLRERLDRGATSTLMLVSAPAGFGKTHAARRVAGSRSGRAGRRAVRCLAVAGPGRQRPGGLLDLRDRRTSDHGARRRRQGARAPAGDAAGPDRDGADDPAQRPRRRRRRPRAGAGRLPPRSTRPTCRRGWRSCSTTCLPRLHLVIAGRADPALPLARLRARGELVEVRAADLRFTPEEAVGLPQRCDGSRAHRRGRGGAGGADRGLDRGAPAGGAVDAGPGRRQRLHRRLRRGRPLRRRLPGRGGAATPARRGPELPAADLRPGPAQRPAVRCRHRRRRWQGDAGGAGPGEPVPGPARRPPPVVPLPPPLRRRAAGAPAGRAARPRPGAAPAGERLVRGERRAGRRHRPRSRRRRTSTARRTWSSWRPRRCNAVARRRPLRRWMEALPDEQFRVRPVLSNDYVGIADVHRSSSRASSRACGTPSDGWTPCRRRTAADVRTGRRRWWSWTRTVPRRCRARSPCTVPGRR